MTRNNVPTRVVYQGNDAVDGYSFSADGQPILYRKSGDVVVLERSVDGVETQLVQDGTHGYALSGVPLSSVPSIATRSDGDLPTGAMWSMRRQSSLEQQTDFQLTADWDSSRAILTDSLDRLMEVIQEVNDKAERALKCDYFDLAFDAKSKQIKNLAAGVAPGDAAVVSQINPPADEAIAAAAAAAASAAAAHDDRVQAGDSAAVSTDAVGAAAGFAGTASDAAEAAVDAQEAAEAAAAAASIIVPPIVSNTMLVDNPAGTLRETKTFPQVRAALFVPSYDDLSYIDASQHGCPGDATDQTAALQAIIDGLPVEGGTILLKGSVYWTQLSAADRHNIRFTGLGGYGTGAQQRTRFNSIAGNLGNGVSAFNLKRTFGVSFERMFISTNNAAFRGTVLDFGDLTSGSALMSMRECVLHSPSTVVGARGINLYGSTQGEFDNVKFSGNQFLIQMQSAVGVGWCNQHTFRSCSFNPTGSQYPIIGSGEGITFQGCNFQASSSDGIGRAWATDLTQPFYNITLIGNTFYDVVTTGGIWCGFYTGRGLNIIGNSVGGAQDLTAGNNYGFAVGGGAAGSGGDPKGVTGGMITGNAFRFMTAGVAFGGAAGTYNNARDMVVGANTAYGSLLPSGTTGLYNSITSTENIVWLPSGGGVANSFGTHFNLRGLPTSATGLQTGDVWNNSGVLTVV